MLFRSANLVSATGNTASLNSSIRLSFTDPSQPTATGFSVEACVGSCLSTSQAAMTASVGSVNVTSGGAKYLSAPTVTFSAPQGTGGVRATGTAALGTGANADKVVSVTITNPGSGYTALPTVSFSNPTGTPNNQRVTATGIVVLGAATMTQTTNMAFGATGGPALATWYQVTPAAVALSAGANGANTVTLSGLILADSSTTSGSSRYSFRLRPVSGSISGPSLVTS